MNVRLLLSPRLASVAAFAVCFVAATAHAQTPSTSSGQAYPSKPVRMIVPFAAAGILDIVARAVGERLSGSLGQQVVVDNRSPHAPELPTIAESGVPGYDVTNWIGMLAPAATPRAIVLKLNREIVVILNAPEMKERFRTQGVDLVGSTPEEFAAFIRSELAKWRKVVKESGAKIG